MSVRRRASGRAHYNYFRDYDPAIGRYVESDPIGLDGGLNTFGYAYSNPVTHSDPSGKIVPAIVGAVTWGYRAYRIYRLARLANSAAIVGTATATGKEIADQLREKEAAEAAALAACQCGPCKTVSGRIVAVGTIGYRPLDVIPDSEMQHGVYGSHHNLFRANQMPFPKCDCFWQKLKDVAKPDALLPEWIPIEPFAN